MPNFMPNNFSHVVFTRATVTFFGKVRSFEPLPSRVSVSASDIDELTPSFLVPLSDSLDSSCCCDCVVFVVCTPANALSPCISFNTFARGCFASTSSEDIFASSSISSSLVPLDDEISATTLRKYRISLSLRSFSVISEAFKESNFPALATISCRLALSFSQNGLCESRTHSSVGKWSNTSTECHEHTQLFPRNKARRF